MRAFTIQKQTVFIDSLTVDAFVGINPSEYTQSQPLVISLWLEINDTPATEGCFLPKNGADRSMNHIVCYDALSKAVKILIQQNHIDLIETLAQEIIQLCFQDNRVDYVTVRIDKPDALQDAKTAGVEIRAARS